MPSQLKISLRNSKLRFASTFGLVVRAFCTNSVGKAMVIKVKMWQLLVKKRQLLLQALDIKLKLISSKILNLHSISLMLVRILTQPSQPTDPRLKWQSSPWVAKQKEMRLSCLFYQIFTATRPSTTACRAPVGPISSTPPACRTPQTMRNWGPSNQIKRLRKQFFKDRRTLHLVGSYSKVSPNMASCTPHPSLSKRF